MKISTTRGLIGLLARIRRMDVNNPARCEKHGIVKLLREMLDRENAR